MDAAQWGEWAGCDAAVACEVVEHVHDTHAFAACLLGTLRWGLGAHAALGDHCPACANACSLCDSASDRTDIYAR